MKFKILILSIALSTSTMAADYKIDIEGMHASIQFKISHLGTSWLRGRFDKFDGNFSYNPKKPNDSKISMAVDVSSINSNHAERDKHLRAKSLLNTTKYPKATFNSESFDLNADSTGTVTGKFTLRGIEKIVTMEIKKVGEGRDPWGGYRVGFEGAMNITLADYGITKYLGKSSKTLELTVEFEGIKQRK
ncbi:Protein yceI precursor [hydrothermal vent metagenome]|uniref:Protein yceI n=1 Tax=hydrothermal vent metagenome TaxID=652676 RepID=A0A3B0W227_9ZZZZ